MTRKRPGKQKRETARARNGGSNGAAPKKETVEVVPGEKLTVDKLERYLWSAADILRGSIDSSDYKNYIFGLLFSEEASDRFEEECESLVKDGDDPEDEDNHQFFVPRKARWSSIQKVATDLGTALNRACSGLEDENGSLEGVLAGIDYNDERKLGEPRNSWQAYMVALRGTVREFVPGVGRGEAPPVPPDDETPRSRRS